MPGLHTVLEMPGLYYGVGDVGITFIFTGPTGCVCVLAVLPGVPSTGSTSVPVSATPGSKPLAIGAPGVTQRIGL